MTIAEINFQREIEWERIMKWKPRYNARLHLLAMAKHLGGYSKKLLDAIGASVEDAANCMNGHDEDAEFMI